VSEEELVQAKNKVLARSVLRSERPMGRLATFGFHWMYQQSYISIDQELEAFNKVGLADVRRLLEDWPLWPTTIVSVGPTTDVHVPE
jgi:predicted Zn-dependent peptidase